MNTIQTYALKFLPEKIQNRYFLYYQILFNFLLFLVLYFFYIALEKPNEKELKILSQKIEFFFEETKTRHKEKLFTYSAWEEMWNLKKVKQIEKVYFQFQQDKSILDNYDYFYLYFDKLKPFIVLKNSRSKKEINLDQNQIKLWYEGFSKNEKILQKIIYIENEFYLLSLSSLKDDAGNPYPLDGILFFLEKLEFIKLDLEKIFSLQMDWIKKTENISDLEIHFQDGIYLQIKEESLINPKIKTSFFSLGLVLFFLHFICSYLFFKKISSE